VTRKRLRLLTRLNVPQGTESYTNIVVTRTLVLLEKRNSAVKHSVYFVKRYSPGHVSAAGDDLIVVQEPATAEVASVTGQLAAHANVAFSSF
jgi:hypothetical protein